MATKNNPSKQSVQKMRNIIADITTQIFMLNTCTPYNADFTYDGDAQTLQVTVYNEKFELILDQIDTWNFLDRAKRLNNYKNFMQLRIKILDLYNTALCPTE